MAVSVRIEDEAFSDIRIVEFGRRLLHDLFRRLDTPLEEALVDRAITPLCLEAGLGCASRLWRQCTQEQTYTLPRTTVAMFCNPDDLIDCRLAEDVGDDMVRIKGTNGRVEWLGRLRKAAKKGGEAKAAYRQAAERASRQKKTTQKSCPPAPAPAPAPALSICQLLQESVTRMYPTSVAGQKSKAPAGWTKDIIALLKTQTEQEIADTIEWLEYGQPPGCAFVVQSAKALREKWDRIQAMRKPRGAQRKPPLDFGEDTPL